MKGMNTELKRKKFLMAYTACVALFYFTAYIITSLLPSSNSETVISNTLPANVTTPLYSGITVTPPEISAQSAVVLDAKSGAVLYTKNSETRLPMASTTKIMTAKIILDKLPLDMKVKVPKEAAFVEGSSIYLSENEEITVESLLYGLLLESGNDAATALAVACSGSVEKFAELMNSTGEKMGLKNTSFANPHGLTAENHFTTAYELAYITMCAMKNETFRKIVSTSKYISPSLDGTLTRYFFNHNKLLRTYNGSTGVKTGYTEAAGRCLVSSAERNGENYICVTLNDRNDWADHTNLLDFAFDNYDSIEIAPENGFAVTYKDIRYINSEPVYMTVGKDEKPIISYRLTLTNHSASADYYSEDTKLGTFNLIPSG